MSADRDLPPDEHLRAALRHAPDAELQAPHDIGERLLAEARRAVQAGAPARAAPWWQRWLPAGSWLPQGALASLLVAGLVTLVWQHEEVPPPTVAARAPEAAARAPEAAAPAPAVAASAAPAIVIAQAPAPPPQAPAPPPARAAKADRAEAARAAEQVAQAAKASEQARSERATAAAAADAAAEARPAPAAAPAATAAPRLRATPQAGALRAAAGIAPAPPWDAATAPPALSALAARVGGPWRDTAQPAGQPLLAWEREGGLVGRAWLERRADAEWLVWCAAGATTCREAPLDQ